MGKEDTDMGMRCPPDVLGASTVLHCKHRLGDHLTSVGTCIDELLSQSHEKRATMRVYR